MHRITLFALCAAAALTPALAGCATQPGRADSDLRARLDERAAQPRPATDAAAGRSDLRDTSAAEAVGARIAGPPGAGVRDDSLAAQDEDAAWERTLQELLARPAATDRVAEGGVAAAGEGPTGTSAAGSHRPAPSRPERRPDADGPGLSAALSGEVAEVYDSVAGLPVVRPTPGSVEETIARAFPAAEVQRAVAVARCESGLRPDVVAGPNFDGSYDHGLFQFNDAGTLQGLLRTTGRDPGNLEPAYDPEWSAVAARMLWQRRGWQPWVCAYHRGILAGLYSSEPGPNGRL